jgi:hypothetical protein
MPNAQLTLGTRESAATGPKIVTLAGSLTLETVASFNQALREFCRRGRVGPAPRAAVEKPAFAGVGRAQSTELCGAPGRAGTQTLLRPQDGRRGRREPRAKSKRRATQRVVVSMQGIVVSMQRIAAAMQRTSRRFRFE